MYKCKNIKTSYNLGRSEYVIRNIRQPLIHIGRGSLYLARRSLGQIYASFVCVCMSHACGTFNNQLGIGSDWDKKGRLRWTQDT